MSSLLPYLVFPGSCKEALTYYAKIFDGEIALITTFGDSPIPVNDPDKSRIYNAELVSELIHLKASDDLPSHPVKAGSNISLFVSFEDTSRQRQVFQELSKGGKILFPLEDKFGMLRDKYDIQWMLAGED